MSGTNSNQHSAETTDSREARPQAGGLLGGQQNQGADRLAAPGGALGAKTEPQAGGNQGGSAGDASASAGTAPGAPAEAGKDASGQTQNSARQEAGQDTQKADAADGSKAAEGEGEHKVAPGANQSDTVNQILADAEKRVKEKGDTDHPETEERNKKIIQEQEQAEKNKKSGEEGGHGKESLVDKVKGKIHHKS